MVDMVSWISDRNAWEVSVVDHKKYAVRAAPNESRIRGRLVKVAPGPEGVGELWKVKVDESEDIGGMSNFGRARVGETISVFVHPYLKRRFSESDQIEARISFQGDEAGAEFFLIGNDVRKL
jgi:hypothetical protein